MIQVTKLKKRKEREGMIVTIILLSLIILKMDLQLYMQTNKATKNIWLSALAVLIGFLVERL